MNHNAKRFVWMTFLMLPMTSWAAPGFAGEPPAAPTASAAPTAPAAPTTPPPANTASPQGSPDAAPSESANVVRARERKQEGDKAMDSLRYADALVAYNEAYTLNPQPALLYNLGRTYEALDRLPEALEKLEAFRSTAPSELLAKVPGLKDRITNLQKRISQLTIKVNIPGARILVRDAVVGQSPLDKPLALKSGKANVLIESEGYFPYRATIDLPGGGGYVVDAQLSSRDKGSRIVVEAPKTNVSISLDGRPMGQAPLEALTNPGTHKIFAQHPDHADYSTSVIVKPGEDRLVVVILSPPPIYKKWWFWTAIGTAVAGGTAAIIAYNTERSPDVGDIPPYKITPSFFVMSPAIQF